LSHPLAENFPKPDTIEIEEQEARPHQQPGFSFERIDHSQNGNINRT
jgi:hypothetical protein